MGNTISCQFLISFARAFSMTSSRPQSKYQASYRLTLKKSRAGAAKDKEKLLFLGKSEAFLMIPLSSSYAKFMTAVIGLSKSKVLV